MKRSPLNRKTPLKRGGASLKRSKLKHQSTEKGKWAKLYRQAKLDNPPPSPNMEPHHPFGRIKDRILCFVWITPEFHQWIHDHSKWASEVGWLQPEFFSRRGETPRPWRSSEESGWPEQYKRKSS